MWLIICCHLFVLKYAWFQAPFQAHQWSEAEVLFVDIDQTGCHHFPYLYIKCDMQE